MSPTPTQPPGAAPGAPGQASSHSRRWVMGAVGVLAAAAGAGVALKRFSPSAVDTANLAGFWDRSFPTPDGGTLALSSLRGQRLLLNFWATWCPPCVHELPMLNGFYREHAAKGWQVLGLAIDQPSAVRKFLARLPLEFPVGLAGLGGTDLGRSLGNLTGGLPFSVVFGADGRVLHRKMGQVTEDDLQAWAKLQS